MADLVRNCGHDIGDGPFEHQPAELVDDRERFNAVRMLLDGMAFEPQLEGGIQSR